ncbi:Hypothetical predicted protein [Cloeon dipterum]|uniref:Kazal-like domain-containing protein n=1 Tax=Cloeon dipterum TaxID=197152 RepID=A0A8S1DUC5_9INSE|nr:Hypothetical predicted protein [Cloeon dipterum]
MKFVLVCFVACMVLVGATAQGAAGDCPTICPLHYAPVCGKNSNDEFRTFSNECGMRAQNCNGKNDFVEEKKGAC